MALPARFQTLSTPWLWITAPMLWTPGGQPR